LRSNDFFDAEKFPKISFVSKGFSKVVDSRYKMTGDFTLKGVTKEIVLDVNFTGVVIDPWGQVKSGFEMETILKRADYGLNWNAQSEDGSVVLSEDVKLQVTAQMIKQA
jgi:polyisoprenoid-binding protein YceI